MRVLFDHNEPFLLAHGGLQVQITRTKAALEKHGVEVDYLRWWDDSQKGDLIHFFGRANPSQIDFAHAKGMKYIMQELLTSQGSRSVTHLRAQAIANRVLRSILPGNYRLPLRWDSYHKADAIIAITNWEAWLMTELFAAPTNRIHVLPNAVDDVYFCSEPNSSGDHLICVATITDRKRVLELAKAAVVARTPLKIIGKPYSLRDPYFQQFIETVKASQGVIEYLGEIREPAELASHLRSARGFVLASAMESQSLAALEAAAAGLPLLLSDLPWAHDTFGRKARYLSAYGQDEFAIQLKRFYHDAPALSDRFVPYKWSDIAIKLKMCYSAL